MTIAQLLRVLPALSLFGCVSDLSPDPYNVNPNQLPKSDGGGDAGGDGGKASDAKLPFDAAGDGEAPNDTGMPSDPVGACDLSGRWIMTERSGSFAYGAEQVSRYWHYLELEQQGASITVKKALFCGGFTVEAPGELLTANVDDQAAWPAYQRYANYTGRKGTSSDNGGGCDVAFDKAVLVRGMTPSAYADETVPLPMQEASGSTPGWEDWDQDQRPGVTMNVTGTAQGRLFTSFRTYGTMSGSIAAGATSFQLAYSWQQQRVVYETDPSNPITRALLASDAEPSPRQEDNFVEFARLTDEQVTGDDDARCEAIRELAPTLNPAANPEK